MTKMLILGIDSLDPYVLREHKASLPNFARLMRESPTFLSKSVFPVDTIPAWASISTGLSPGNHGLLYAYDIFDPTMGDLQKLSIQSVKGRTFWDYLSREGYACVIVFPQLMYPPWDVNGTMVGISPMERRLDWISTELSIRACPGQAMAKYNIPSTLRSLWGGFPGLKHLEEWIALGKSALEAEKRIALSLCENESWDLFFAYFNLLDIIQHRLWRFFDEHDPTYPGDTVFKGTIIDYYKLVDSFVGEFIEVQPEASLLVLSDHGHRQRPTQTVNVNEALRKAGYVAWKGSRARALNQVRKCILDVANRLNLEHYLIRLVVIDERLTRAGKSMYSSAGSIDRHKSRAFVSNFAGIKSYEHGAVEINRELVSDAEYEETRNALITTLYDLRLPDQRPLMEFVKAREDIDPGRFSAHIFPDILFRLQDGYGVGWELHSALYGRARDHFVASGGHSKDAVLLLRNVKKAVLNGIPSIMNVAPSILDLFGIDWRALDMDGATIFAG
jgi:predicted AlkP superfamily phosphohydrolase/phosphomutase